ncbi:helix-turn-helix domain-containing protein [Branchiibius cervicis]|uniref:Helix-turn-helix domain-containing protein n=1 Tax=Branchiibius cervicis TaxID=908252 RepID=A0ABW2ATQ5_9MICO
MVTRTKPTHLAERGVLLDPAGFARHATLQRWRSAMNPQFVEHFWSVSWDLPPGTRYVASLVPLSAINLTNEWGGSIRHGAERPGSYITGVVSRRRFDVTLYGWGHVVGIRYRPGAFSVITGIDARSLRDRTFRAEKFIGQVDPLEGIDPRQENAALRFDAFVSGQVDRYVYDLDEAESILERAAIVDAAEASSVAELADQVGLTERSLERLSNFYIGVGPKWLLMRRRVHQSLQRLNAAEYESLSGLAHDLGWFDYAHFSRDFKRIVGQTPRAYASALTGT